MRKDGESRGRRSAIHLLIGERAITFIEIIVMIIVLGILATFVAPRIFSWVDEARRSQAKNQIASFGSALQLFYIDNGYYPSTEQGLEALVAGPTVGKLPTNYRPGGYIDKLPRDPWGNPYVYELLEDSQAYRILSYGADGQPDGEGNDEDISSQDLS
ncbi:MAG: type II secretion system major pseudopilin GspG [Nitrospinota bacterium]